MSDSSADDAARKREYMRRYYQENREAIRDYQQRYREKNRGRLAQYGREYRTANGGTLRARKRAYEDANREKVNESQRRWYRANSGSEYQRRRRRRYRLKQRHGLGEATWAYLWDAQHGKCRYCQRDLDEEAIIEHYHGCSAGHPKEESCPICRRGIACQACNKIIGFAKDDPDLLRHIADSLEAANRLVQERQLEAPRQLMLELE